MTVDRAVVTALSLVVGFGLIVIGLTPLMLVGAGFVLVGLFGPSVGLGKEAAQPPAVQVHLEPGFTFGSPVNVGEATDEELETAELSHLDEARRIAAVRRSRRGNRGSHHANPD
jgi:hypothetical protein